MSALLLNYTLEAGLFRQEVVQPPGGRLPMSAPESLSPVRLSLGQVPDLTFSACSISFNVEDVQGNK